MSHSEDLKLTELFKVSKKIAVIGLSDKPERSSYGVAEYLKRYYEIIPVNPLLKDWQGIKAYPDIETAAREHDIDIVNIFRRSAEVPSIVNDILKLSQQSLPKCVWMQLGVSNNEAKALLDKAGIYCVMDACIAVLHRQYANS